MEHVTGIKTEHQGYSEYKRSVKLRTQREINSVCSRRLLTVVLEQMVRDSITVTGIRRNAVKRLV